MIHDKLKKGTFRWRKKFRCLPNREQLVNELGVEWLANRLYYVLTLHYINNPNHELQMFRHKWLNHIYIMNSNVHTVTLEIIEVQD